MPSAVIFDSTRSVGRRYVTPFSLAWKVELRPVKVTACGVVFCDAHCTLVSVEVLHGMEGGPPPIEKTVGIDSHPGFAM